MDRVTMIPVKDLGADRIRRTVRGGMGQMPFEETTRSRMRISMR